MTKVSQVRTKSAKELLDIYSKLTPLEVEFLSAVLMLDGVKHETWVDLDVLEKNYRDKKLLMSLYKKKAIELK